MRAACEGLSGVPATFDGRAGGGRPSATAAAADPCQRHPDQRPGAGAGQVVPEAARRGDPDLRRGDAGYLRAHGNIAPVRYDRAAPWAVRAGAVRTRFQGYDGCRNPAGTRLADPVLALITPLFHAT